MRKRHSGFTLIELLVVISVASILIFIAIPNFRDSVKKNSIETVQGRLKNSVNQAKTESLSRGRSVVICGSSNGNACNGSSDWSSGWIVFVDDGNGAGVAGDNVRHGDEERVAYQNIEGTNAINSKDTSGNVNSIAFNSLGYLDNGNASTIRVCGPDGDVSFARSVVILVSGLSAASRDSSGDSDYTHEDVSGSNLTCS